MIYLAPAHLKSIVDAAERAYPHECCGLLVGRTRARADLAVRGVVASANLAPDPARRFEIDPALRLRLQRELRTGPDRVIGTYHSHPDLAAEPSQADLDAAWEADLVWLITAVYQGQAAMTTAHRLRPDGRAFVALGLRTTDRRPPPRRAAPGAPTPFNLSDASRGSNA